MHQRCVMRKKATVDEFVERPVRAVVFGDNKYSKSVWGRLLQGLNDENKAEANCVIIRDRQADKKARQFNRYALSFKRGAKESLMDINCVSTVIDPYSDYNSFSDLADNNGLTTVLWAPEEKSWLMPDKKLKNDKNTPLAMLTMLLFRRFCQEKRGFDIISAMNEENNGEILKNEIIGYASVRGLGMDFVNWLTMENRFINTFVETRVGAEVTDSIQSIDSEIYFFCAMDKKDRLLSLSNSVNVFEELSSYYLLRRHVYEGALCSACAYALLHDIDTLDAFMMKEKLKKHMTVSVFEEIIPALDVNFETVQAYTVEMLQRFEDPSVTLSLMDYAQNLGDKLNESIVPLISRFAQIHERLPKHLVFSLFCTLKLYEVIDINDNFSKRLKEARDHYSTLWCEDITYLKEEIEALEKKMG